MMYVRRKAARTAACAAAFAMVGGASSILFATDTQEQVRPQAKFYEARYAEDRAKKSDDDRAFKGPHDRVLREMFGATLRPLPHDEARGKGLKPGMGLVVDSVKSDSPAQRGGLRTGDVIAQLDDQKIINAEQLATLLALQEADDDFELTVRRGDESVDLDYELDRADLERMAVALRPDGLKEDPDAEEEADHGATAGGADMAQ